MSAEETNRCGSYARTFILLNFLDIAPKEKKALFVENMKAAENMQPLLKLVKEKSSDN